MLAPDEMTPETLYATLGRPDTPAIVDVRTDEDFDQDPNHVPTSRRGAKDAAYPAGAHRVFLCHKGLKLSQGAAALHRAAGGRASVLLGGHVAWRSAGLPTVRAGGLPRNARWVLPAPRRLETLVGHWFIRRFLDPDATILEVPPEHARDVAARFDAALAPLSLPECENLLTPLPPRLVRMLETFASNGPLARSLQAGLADRCADPLDALLPLCDMVFAGCASAEGGATR